jgi:hypothetical protein
MYRTDVNSDTKRWLVPIAAFTLRMQRCPTLCAYAWSSGCRTCPPLQTMSPQQSRLRGVSASEVGGEG